MNKAFLAVLVSLMWLGAAEARQEKGVQYLSLFHISKEVNANVVYYEAAVTADCRLDNKKPVMIYWILGSGKREGLNFFEKGAFPLDVRSKSADTIVGDIKALKEKVRFPLTIQVGWAEGKCAALATAPGFAKLEKVHLSQFKGYEPKTITVKGLDLDGHLSEFPIVSNGVSMISRLQVEK
ncbi:MAG TPA: DUF4833 domain-containing protein [Bdellovibrionales bacterium]|nr:DUF4833 domain-containing protein [Bdellovibrionales bacterium]